MDSPDTRTHLDVIRACVADVLSQAEAARRVAERARALLNDGDPKVRASDIRSALARLHTCTAELHEVAAYAHGQTTACMERLGVAQG